MSAASTEKTATVLGGGSWGTALASIIAGHGYRTLLWMRDAELAEVINTTHRNPRYLRDAELSPGIEATTDLKYSVASSEITIVAIPSKHLRSVVREVGDYISGDRIVLSATKGLEAPGLKRMTEVIAEETCVMKLGALSGPNLAKEIVAGQPAATVVASPFQEVIEKTERLLAGPTFRLYGNFDLAGVEYAGALKNIYAIAGGIAAGLGLGSNTLSTLITRGLAEMCRFGQRYGAEALTFQGLAGVGDLVATCSSTLSRNHTVGRHLAQGKDLDTIFKELNMVAEGVNTAKVIAEHAEMHKIDMPIASAVDRVLFRGASPQDALSQLMDRSSRYEHGDTFIHEGGDRGTH